MTSGLSGLQKSVIRDLALSSGVELELAEERVAGRVLDCPILDGGILLGGLGLSSTSPLNKRLLK